MHPLGAHEVTETKCQTYHWRGTVSISQDIEKNLAKYGL